MEAVGDHCAREPPAYNKSGRTDVASYDSKRCRANRKLTKSCLNNDDYIFSRTVYNEDMDKKE